MPDRRWPEAREAALRRLWADGLTDPQIAAALRISLQSVASKRHRLRLGNNYVVERARLVNAEPWEPLPGMVKRRCGRCRYWFATPAGEPRLFCPDCLLEVAPVTGRAAS